MPGGGDESPMRWRGRCEEYCDGYCVAVTGREEPRLPSSEAGPPPTYASGAGGSDDGDADDAIAPPDIEPEASELPSELAARRPSDSTAAGCANCDCAE